MPSSMLRQVSNSCSSLAFSLATKDWATRWVRQNTPQCVAAIKSGQGDVDRKGCERLKAKVEGYSSPCGALSDYDGYEKRTVPGAKTQMKLLTLNRGFRTSLRRG